MITLLLLSELALFFFFLLCAGQQVGWRFGSPRTQLEEVRATLYLLQALLCFFAFALTLYLRS